MSKFILYAAFFFFFSFLGWLLECIWCTVGETRRAKKFVPINRGFLSGPFCPIYGCSAIAMELTLRSFESNIIIVFLLGILVCDAVEYLTSFIMEKLFNARWWDYSDRFLNLNGRICLKHTIMWGFMCVIFIKFISPPVFKVLLSIPQHYLHIAVNIISILFILDLLTAIVTTIDLNILRSKIKSAINATEEPDIEIVEVGSSNNNSLTERLNDIKVKMNSISFSRKMNIKRIIMQTPLLKEQINNQFNQLKNSIDITDEVKDLYNKLKEFLVNLPYDEDFKHKHDNDSNTDNNNNNKKHP